MLLADQPEQGTDAERQQPVHGAAVVTLAFDSKRYVGAQIGIHNPRGEKVGRVSHLRNVEYVVVAADEAIVHRIPVQPYDKWTADSGVKTWNVKDSSK